MKVDVSLDVLRSYPMVFLTAFQPFFNCRCEHKYELIIFNQMNCEIDFFVQKYDGFEIR